MKSIAIESGGPLMPKSKSRAMVRSVVRRGSSRCPIPGGATQAAASSSLSHAESLLPRFAPIT